MVKSDSVLALPVKVRVIDPVVHVLVLVSSALFVERDQQDVGLFLGQHHMADVSAAGVVRFAKLGAHRLSDQNKQHRPQRVG